MIFQEPMSAFDPLYTVGYQMLEVLKAHTKLSSSEQKLIAIRWLKNVGIPEAERRLNQYPHEMSGGMLQRVMIAMVLMLQPEVLIADEPTTALDVTIQAQVLGLIRNLQKEEGTSVLFITHDLGVVAEIADRVHVMYAGKIVEKGTAAQIFHHPLHPYTIGLLTSRVVREKKDEVLPFIPGYVPRAYEFPDGCRFHPRCARKLPKCERELPPEISRGQENTVACWLYAKEADG
jgi:oligopeptide/dipeptide ABC transporter ATP-binding protein